MEVSNSNFTFIYQYWSFLLQDTHKVENYTLDEPRVAIYACRTHVSGEFIVYKSVEQKELATCKDYLQVSYQELIYV